jgi:uncharacterized membrane protein YraQ (UPF0718 family)
MARLWAWLGAPIVIGHAGCIASPAVAMALGVPIVMPVCGGGLAPLLPALGAIGLQVAVALAVAGAVTVVARRFQCRNRSFRKRFVHLPQAPFTAH